jgi:plastocyanin
MTASLALRAFFFAAAVSVSAASAQQVATAPSQVTIQNFAFSPPTLTIAAGTRVEWVNRDGTPHTVIGVGKPAPFKSPALDTGDSFGQVFSTPGTYAYFCGMHPMMVGKIIVK